MQDYINNTEEFKPWLADMCALIRLGFKSNSDGSRWHKSSKTNDLPLPIKYFPKAKKIAFGKD